MRALLLSMFSVIAIAGCVNAVDDEGSVMGAGVVNSDEKAFTATCAPGSTVKGIDVSYYQGTINWSAVAGDGVKYAFIRVSDGGAARDTKFSANMAGAKANGVARGVYQFFRANQDPIAEADLLINAIGQLQPGDLPPVIDVEAANGQSAATIQRKVGQWLDHVEAALGVRPIVYTGPYFWRDTVGGPDQTRSPLWIAHYGTTCPFVPAHWTAWTFHQHADDGHVAGISGGVDMDLFNGTLAQLQALEIGGAGPAQPPPSTDPGTTTPPPATSTGDCTALDASGGVIDDGDACFHAGGGAQWLNHVTTAGNGGDLITTGTTAATTTENYAEWTINVAAAGTYELEAYVDVGHGTSQQADYKITSQNGTTDAVISQSAHKGWVSLGAYAFRTGAGQKVRLNDNTGEHSSLNRTLTFDGLRVTPVDDSGPAADPCPRLQIGGTGSSLNIRPQANTTHAAIGVLHDGSIVDRLSTVTGESVSGNTTWYKITDGQVTGFITAVYATCHS